MQREQRGPTTLFCSPLVALRGLNRVVGTSAFAKKNFIRKELREGKCCCYLTCRSKLGMNLLKLFLHRANSGRKVSRCVEGAASCGLMWGGSAFPGGSLAFLTGLLAVTEFHRKHLNKMAHSSAWLDAKM